MGTEELLYPLLGGIIIGLACGILLLFNGRIAGISGIFSGVILPKKGDFLWKSAFTLGLGAGGILMFSYMPDSFIPETSRSSMAIVVAGLFVGFGTRLGNGCTSGHGICGLSRLSPRSFLAVLTFMTTAAITTFVISHFLGGNI